jgi:hypothetical protein
MIWGTSGNAPRKILSMNSRAHDQAEAGVPELIEVRDFTTY